MGDGLIAYGDVVVGRLVDPVPGRSGRLQRLLRAYRQKVWQPSLAGGQRMDRSSLRPAETFVQAAGIERRPGPIRARGSMILVELHERMDEVTADGTGAEHIG
jgi:hypothetical protein